MSEPRRVHHLVLALSAAAAIAGLLAGCRPTLTPVLDPVLTALVAAVVTWAAAAAPWWVLAAASTAVAVPAGFGWVGSLAVLSCVAALGVGARLVPAQATSAGAGALLVVAGLHLEIQAFAVSALVSGSAFALVVVAGILGRSWSTRRRAAAVVAVLAAGIGLAVVGAAAGALAARADIVRGVDAARDGLTALRRGDADTAAVRLREAAAALSSARSRVRGPWMWPARAVPVLGQHVRAAASLVDAARGAASTVADEVGAIDLESVRVQSGRIDLDALADLRGPLAASEAAVARLDDAVADSRSPWLVGPVASRLRDLAAETSTARDQASTALVVTDVAPRLLGADGPRVWLVLFTTPSEARGLGGFPGNFAELTVDGGRIVVSRVGRAVDLINGGSDPEGRTISGPDDYLSRYGEAGAGGPGQPARRIFWNNVTLSPDLPSVAAVVAELYPQSGGRAIDGVIVADPYALQGIVGITGPLTVQGRDAPLTTADTAEFLLREQYTVFPEQNQERKDALAEVAVQATQALLGGDLPSPAVIAQWLGGPIRDGHLMLWSLHPDDQPALRTLGVGGEFPRPAPDGIAYTVNNSGPNKLDAYLTRSLVYEAVVDKSGEVSATVTVRLRNDVPLPLALPDDIVANEKGLPPGTNRSWLAIYSPLGLVDGTVGGGPRALAAARELGWNVYTTYVDVAPGAEVEIVVRLRGELDLADGYALTVRPQPLAAPNEVRLDVRDSHGERLIDHTGPLDVVTASLVGRRISS